MPIQEAIVWDPLAPLARPAGVGFGAPCSTKDADEASWKRAIPKLRTALKAGSFVGILVQTRNGRPWSEEAKNYLFNYDEDYLVAAYILDAGLGEPWRPGMMIMDWLSLFSFSRPGLVEYQPTAGLDQVFQCSKNGCALTRNGPVTLVKFFEKGGASRGEAIAKAMGESLMPKTKDQKGRRSAGWIGGDFPKQTRARSGLKMGFRPPSYQAPTPLSK